MREIDKCKFLSAVAARDRGGVIPRWGCRALIWGMTERADRLLVGIIEGENTFLPISWNNGEFPSLPPTCTVREGFMIGGDCSRRFAEAIGAGAPVTMDTSWVFSHPEVNTLRDILFGPEMESELRWAYAHKINPLPALRKEFPGWEFAYCLNHIDAREPAPDVDSGGVRWACSWCIDVY